MTRFSLRVWTVALMVVRPLSVVVCTSLGLLLVTGCANGPLGNSLQRSLEADPQLQDQSRFDESAPEETPAEPDPSGASDEPPASEDTALGPQLPNAEDGSAAESGNPSADTNGDRNTTALLAEVPADLRPYVEDWVALGLAEQNAQAETTTLAGIPFQPNQTITRGEYAQWLLSANNQFYQNQPTKRIRPGSPTSTPAFQDVPTSHPYYSAIQGLAEAGMIPSALGRNSTAVEFRPSDPLTREHLLLWKVPLDTRSVLPAATVEAVEASWGFQDAAEIDPLALRAVLADRQGGDFANILRAYGFTTLFLPKKAVTQAEAAAVLWRFGSPTEGVSVKDQLQRLNPSAAPNAEGSRGQENPSAD